LLVILWWFALLIFALTRLTSATRGDLLIAANLRGGAIAEAAADGAVNKAIFQILANRWEADGAPHLVTDAQSVTEVRIDDEGKKVDVNVAPVALLRALLRACGASANVAGPLALAIYEWRVPGLPSPERVERAAEYRASGLGYAPPNKRFVSLDELGLVLGMTPDLLGCLAPRVSIHSLSLPSSGFTGDRVVRQALAEAYGDDAARPADADARTVTVVRISAVARASVGGGFRRVAIVRVARATLDETFAYRILEWEGGEN
jgi:general secretion pathway protein K